MVFVLYLLQVISIRIPKSGGKRFPLGGTLCFVVTWGSGLVSTYPPAMSVPTQWTTNNAKAPSSELMPPPAEVPSGMIDGVGMPPLLPYSV